MRRLRTPDYVAGLGGIVLAVGTFTPGGALGVIDVLLLLIGFAAVTVPVVTALSADPAPAIKADVLTAWVMLFAVIVTVVRTIGGTEWAVALVGALVAFTGLWWAMRLEAAPGLRPPPETEPMPAPPAHAAS